MTQGQAQRFGTCFSTGWPCLLAGTSPFETASIMCDPLQKAAGLFVLVHRATADPPASWNFRLNFGFHHAERARDLHRDALWPGPALKAQHEIEVLDQNRRSSPSVRVFGWQHMEIVTIRHAKSFAFHCERNAIHQPRIGLPVPRFSVLATQYE